MEGVIPFVYRKITTHKNRKRYFTIDASQDAAFNLEMQRSNVSDDEGTKSHRRTSSMPHMENIKPPQQRFQDDMTKAGKESSEKVGIAFRPSKSVRGGL